MLESNVTDRIPKVLMIGIGVLSLGLVYLAYSRPGYFANPGSLGAVLLLESLIVALSMYRKILFPLLIVVFLFAGIDLPVGSIWPAARWFCLCIGALAGVVIALKDRRLHFGALHVIASFAVLAA